MARVAGNPNALLLVRRLLDLDREGLRSLLAHADLLLRMYPDGWTIAQEGHLFDLLSAYNHSVPVGAVDNNERRYAARFLRNKAYRRLIERGLHRPPVVGGLTYAVKRSQLVIVRADGGPAYAADILRALEAA